MTQWRPGEPNDGPDPAHRDPWAPDGEQPTTAHPFGPPSATPPQYAPPPEPPLERPEPGPSLGSPPPAFGSRPGEPSPAFAPQPAHPTLGGPAQEATPAPPAGGGRRRAWPALLAGVVALVVLCGLVFGTYLLLGRDRPGQPAARRTPGGSRTAASAEPSPSPVDIGSRRTDSRPLTEQEVFGTDDVSPDPGREAVYHVLARDHQNGSCTRAGSGGIDRALRDDGCDQVVRATLAAPVDGYVLTAGICNLLDTDSAQSAAKAITVLGGHGHGSLTGFSAPGARKLGRSATLFTLQPYGHYLLYVVIGRDDGAAPSDGAATQQIVTDIVRSYLTGVLDTRREGG